MRAALLFTLLTFGICLGLIFYDEPRVDEDAIQVDELYHKYVHSDILFLDTVINYTLNGDSIILKFPRKPGMIKCKVEFWLQHSGKKIHELDANNQFIVEHEYVRTLSDTADFSILLLPIYEHEIVVHDDWVSPKAFLYGNDKKGHLITTNMPAYGTGGPHSTVFIDIRLLKEIQDSTIRAGVIGKINERLANRRADVDTKLPNTLPNPESYKPVEAFGQ